MSAFFCSPFFASCFAAPFSSWGRDPFDAEFDVILLNEVIEAPQFTPQLDECAIYAEKITPEDRELNLDDPFDAWRRVRALSPHIGAWTTMHDRRVVVWRAHLEDGTFVPDVVQPEGRGHMSYDAFLRGVK